MTIHNLAKKIIFNRFISLRIWIEVGEETYMFTSVPKSHAILFGLKYITAALVLLKQSAHLPINKLCQHILRVEEVSMKIL